MLKTICKTTSRYIADFACIHIEEDYGVVYHEAHYTDDNGITHYEIAVEVDDESEVQ